MLSVSNAWFIYATRRRSKTKCHCAISFIFYKDRRKSHFHRSMGDERNRSRIVSYRGEFRAFRLEKPRGLIAACLIHWRLIFTPRIKSHQVMPDNEVPREHNDEKKTDFVTRSRRRPCEPDTSEVLISRLMYKIWRDSTIFFTIMCTYLYEDKSTNFGSLI